MRNAVDFDPAMAAQNPDLDGLSWHSAFDPSLSLLGFAWNTDQQKFRRLPDNTAGDIPEAVDHLANNCAGGQIRFCSNSKRIAINVVLPSVSHMVHMPTTGHSGCDLYVKKDGRYIFYSACKYNPQDSEYALLLFMHEEEEEREFLINLPLYQGVNSLHVGIDDGANIAPAKELHYNKRIVVYGTSITQGGCASRPGMCCSNILSRAIDAEWINLGFSGNGKGEPALARYISDIENIGLIILDYQANTGAVGIAATMAEFVRVLREHHPEIPILIISKPPYIHALIQKNDQEHTERENAWQQNFVTEQQQQGDHHIYFLDGCTDIEDQYMEGTVDGVHPNDLGFQLIAQHWLPTIRSILKL